MKHVFAVFIRLWYVWLLILLFVWADWSNVIPGLNLIKSQTRMVSTAVVVEEIKEINELITAEFYGEVYGDLAEAYQVYVQDAYSPENKDSLNDIYPKANDYKRVLDAMNRLKARWETLQVAVDSLQTGNAPNQALDNMQQERDKVFERYKNQRQKLQQLQKDTRLVYIGRGWVKAGFDFQSLDEADITITRQGNDSVRVMLPKPIILNADINPWFIRDEVKGYEIFQSNPPNGGFTDQEITLVKILCKQKLIEAARQKAILEKAESAGAESLQNFFALLGYPYTKVTFR